jgi:hypothetical protein
MMRSIAVSLFLAVTVVQVQISTTYAFQSFFKIPSFQPNVNSKAPTSIISKENELLKSISNTANGKDATTTQQMNILKLVRDIETQCPPDEDMLTNPLKSKDIDGVWYLQYTSPSVIESNDVDEDDNTQDGNNNNNNDDDTNEWKPEINEDPKIETKQIKSKGSVSAAGITVDVSNKTPKQIFDFDQGLFFNEVVLDYGSVRVGGPFKLSDKVSNRVIACFDQGKIELNFGLNIDLNLVFKLINIARGTEEGGWLETTYLSDGVRIGRGNKGTMFVLTRDRDAVTP